MDSEYNLERLILEKLQELTKNMENSTLLLNDIIQKLSKCIELTDEQCESLMKNIKYE